MMREGLARGRAEAIEENAEIEAANDGVFMSTAAKERKQKKDDNSKLPPIV